MYSHKDCPIVSTRIIQEHRKLREYILFRCLAASEDRNHGEIVSSEAATAALKVKHDSSLLLIKAQRFFSADRVDSLV